MAARVPWGGALAGGLMAVVAVALIGGCGSGGRNREELTWTYDEVLSAAGWVADTYDAWRQTIDLEGELPTYSDLGAYPIGNGRVFAISGLSIPLGTVQDMLGPTYQKVSGLLGAVMPAVLLDGEPADTPRQSSAWVAPCGVVHHRWDGELIRVEILQTVPPELDAVLSLILVTNETEQRLGDVALALQASLPVEPAGGDLLHARGQTRVRMGFAGARTWVRARSVVPPLPVGLSDLVLPLGRMTRQVQEPQSVICPLGRLGPGESVAKLAYVTFADGEAAEQGMLAAIEEKGLALFDQSHQWWSGWAEGTVQVEGAGEEIEQFLAISRYLCRVQQAQAGGYSPMHKYTYRWIRDSNGPIMYLLDAGDFESVARDLAYHFAACAQRGEIGNNVPLNLDLGETPAIQWAKVESPKAEIASFVILQNAWYWRHTGETAQLEQRWPYLVRAFEGHAVDDQGRLPFHGDETYRFPGYELHSVDDTPCPDYLHLQLRSADSAFEYVAAAEAMAQMAEAIGREDEVAGYLEAARRVREATEEHYWQRERGYYAPAMSDLSGERYRYPFANISLRPLWIGYAQADEQRQIDNVLNALAYLWRPESGTARLTPAFGYYVGMTPGYVLSALCAIDHPAAERALEGLLAAAEPSGGFAEMNRPDDTPSRDIWGLHRVRPWEGGINASAVLQYLTGFEPDAPNRRVRFAPHLPGDSMAMTVSNLRVAEARLRLSVSFEVARTRYVVECVEADEPVELELLASAPGSELSAAEGNWRELGGRTRSLPARFGRAHLLISGATLEQGDLLDIRVEASGYADPAELEVADEPFDYGVADVPRGSTVLVTWSKQVADAVREREGDVVVLDTRIAWPAAYLRSALLTDDGEARAERVILDVSGWPGAFKPGRFWIDGEGAEIIAQFQAVGGEVIEAKVPGAGGAPSAELIN
ncbi:MAG: hypothetical protein AB7Y46_00050 [Armatimonadota bacterium]